MTSRTCRIAKYVFAVLALANLPNAVWSLVIGNWHSAAICWTSFLMCGLAAVVWNSTDKLVERGFMYRKAREQFQRDIEKFIANNS